jgi:hypothetical protein
MNNNEYSIIMTRIITLELLPQGNLDSSRGDSQGSHIPANFVRIQKFLLKRWISRRLKRGIPEQG